MAFKYDDFEYPDHITDVLKNKDLSPIFIKLYREDVKRGKYIRFTFQKPTENELFMRYMADSAPYRLDLGENLVKLAIEARTNPSGARISSKKILQAVTLHVEQELTGSLPEFYESDEFVAFHENRLRKTASTIEPKVSTLENESDDIIKNKTKPLDIKYTDVKKLALSGIKNAAVKKTQDMMLNIVYLIAAGDPHGANSVYRTLQTKEPNGSPIKDKSLPILLAELKKNKVFKGDIDKIVLSYESS